MATVKLTLSADEEVVRKARRLARKENTSISAMFSRFILIKSGRERPTREERLGPLTRKALGLCRLPPGASYRKVLEEALVEKYGVGK